MEKVIECGTWSLNWPPPEFEKAKRMIVACSRFLRSCLKTILVVLFVAPPQQERIEEARQKARQYFPQI